MRLIAASLPLPLDVPFAGRQGLLSRVGDEHLQDCLMHAVTAPAPLGGMPPVLPETRTPHGHIQTASTQILVANSFSLG